MNTSISLGGVSFRNKTEAEKHIRNILSRHENMQALTGDDLAFVVAILDKHPNYDAIVDCGVRRIVVQHLHDRYDSRRFLLERIDGSIRDFTWRTALTPKAARSRVMKACRYAIRDQIKAFRAKAFDHAITQTCALSGMPIVPTDCDVDHIPPATFEALVDAWLRCNQLDESDIALVPVVGYEQPDKWEDTFLEENWREYHRTHARLRILHQTIHRSLIRQASANAQ
jgi:hypothetical protein